MCALKRPFDDQSQARIALETHAVTRILTGSEKHSLEVCNSAALTFENELNPNATRKERVRAILARFGEPTSANPSVFARAAELREQGLDDVDALHLATAERQGAEHFVRCDDGLLKKARRLDLPINVVDPSRLVEEFDV